MPDWWTQWIPIDLIMLLSRSASWLVRGPSSSSSPCGREPRCRTRVQQDREQDVGESRDSGRSHRRRAAVVVGSSGVGRVKQRPGHRGSETAEEVAQLLQRDNENVLERNLSQAVIPTHFFCIWQSKAKWLTHVIVNWPHFEDSSSSNATDRHSGARIVKFNALTLFLAIFIFPFCSIKFLFKHLASSNSQLLNLGLYSHFDGVDRTPAT